MVEGCRRRNAKAQRTLYDEMAPMVSGVCARFASCHDEAQDMMQDAFIKVFERISALDDSACLQAWVHTIAVNTCLDHLRKRRRWQLLGDIDEMVSAVDFDPFPAEEIVAEIQRLTPMLRTVFNLCDVEGYTIEETAQLVGSNRQAVRTALSRARSELRKELATKKEHMMTLGIRK